ncbi:MAG: hypothetical protein ACJ71H_13720 [Nitrososphaeraceae archaeon]
MGATPFLVLILQPQQVQARVQQQAVAVEVAQQVQVLVQQPVVDQQQVQAAALQVEVA